MQNNVSSQEEHTIEVKCMTNSDNILSDSSADSCAPTSQSVDTSHIIHHLWNPLILVINCKEKEVIIFVVIYIYIYVSTVS